MYLSEENSATFDWKGLRARIVCEFVLYGMVVGHPSNTGIDRSRHVFLT
jgi:hypothetical protein